MNTDIEIREALERIHRSIGQSSRWAKWHVAIRARRELADFRWECLWGKYSPYVFRRWLRGE